MTDSSNKDFNPKHRVVGAIVLVAVAVIVLPLILDRGHDDWHADQDAAAPAVENQVFVADLTRGDSQAASVTPPASSATPPATAGPASASVPAARTSTTAAASVPTTATKTAPAPRNAPARPTAATADKGFYVQVGTFSSQANAKQLANRLKQQGYPVHLEQVRLASGDALRVRVGPYGQDAQAQAARTAIQRKLNVQGIVRAY